MNDHIQPAQRVGKQVSWWVVAGILAVAVIGWVAFGIVLYDRVFTPRPAKVVTLAATCPQPREGFHILACTLSEANYRSACRNRFKRAGR
jgi:hypothetical protein